MQMNLVYDVAHNIAKMEEHTIDGRKKPVCVHRKGATRAFPPGHPRGARAVSRDWTAGNHSRGHGSGELGPGGREGSMQRSFGSTCHGAGRVMSRTAAVAAAKGRRIDQELAEQGVVAKCRSWKGLAEEQPAAYKDVSRVVDIVHRAGLAAKVARLRPVGVVKG